MSHENRYRKYHTVLPPTVPCTRTVTVGERQILTVGSSRGVVFSVSIRTKGSASAHFHFISQLSSYLRLCFSLLQYCNHCFPLARLLSSAICIIVPVVRWFHKRADWRTPRARTLDYGTSTSASEKDAVPADLLDSCGHIYFEVRSLAGLVDWNRLRIKKRIRHCALSFY